MFGQILETSCVQKIDQLAGGDRATSRQGGGVNEAGARERCRFRMKRDGHKQRSTGFQGVEDVVNAGEECLAWDEPLGHPRQVVAVLIAKVRYRLESELDAVRESTSCDFGLRKPQHVRQHVEANGTCPRISLNEPDRDR